MGKQKVVIKYNHALYIFNRHYLFPADGMTYSFGVFYAEFLTYFDEGKGKTAWIVSILVGVTLSSGMYELVID